MEGSIRGAGRSPRTHVHGRFLSEGFSALLPTSVCPFGWGSAPRPVSTKTRTRECMTLIRMEEKQGHRERLRVVLGLAVLLLVAGCGRTEEPPASAPLDASPHFARTAQALETGN